MADGSGNTSQEGQNSSIGASTASIAGAGANSSALAIKFKYKEAYPPPAEIDPTDESQLKIWGNTFSAADSRLYTRYKKNASKSAAARASGETRALALEMLTANLLKAGLNPRNPTTSSPAPTTNTVNTANTTTFAPTTSHSSVPISKQIPHRDNVTTFAPNTSYSSVAVPHTDNATTSTPTTSKSSAPNTEPIAHTDNTSHTTVTSHAVVDVEMDSDPSRGGTPNPFQFGTSSGDATPSSFTFPSSNIADNVKGKSRTKKQSSTLSSKQGSPTTPAIGFGQHRRGSADMSSKRKMTAYEEQMQEEIIEGLQAMDPAELYGSSIVYEAYRPENNRPEGIDYSRVFAPPGEKVASNTSPPESSEPKKTKQRKKREGRKKAAALKAAEIIPDSPRSPVPSESGDDESNDGGVYCICRKPDDHRRMIACDSCDEWFHCNCVNIKEYDVDLIDRYVCLRCEIPTKNTTWKPMCRLLGCRKPAAVTANPPSKYCSPAHRKRWAEQEVAKMSDSTEPSRGGALTKGELKAILEQTKGDVKAFHALGKKPTLPPTSVPVDWNKLLTNEEKGRLVRITITRQKHNASSEGYKDKAKLVKMAAARMRKVVEEDKELVGICGWDPRLAMNEEEFSEWRNGVEGKRAFDTGVLEGKFCDKKRCTAHHAWIKTHTLDANEEDLRIQKQINKLRIEEGQIQDRAKTRMAARQQ